MGAKEQARAKRQQRKSEGLCTQCGGKSPVNGMETCQNCLDKAKAYYRSYKKQKKCTYCDSKAVEGKTRCQSCQDKANEISRQKRSEYEKYKLCVTCGKSRPLVGKACQICTALEAGRSTLRRNAKTAKRTCYYCEKPPRPGLTTCQGCADKLNSCEHYKFNRLKSQANARRREFGFTVESFYDWYDLQPKECHYCGIDFTLLECKDNILARLSIDRMDNNDGYVPGNVCLACMRCNSGKSDFYTYEQWKFIADNFIKPELMKYHRL